MLKNRYFKTTFGAPTELAFGVLPTVSIPATQVGTTFPNLTAVAGECYTVRSVPGHSKRYVSMLYQPWYSNTGVPGIITGTAVTAANTNLLVLSASGTILPGALITGTAQLATGSMIFAVPTTTPGTYTLNAAAGGVATIGFTAINPSAQFTASSSGTTLTVSAMAANSGPLTIGMTITGTATLTSTTLYTITAFGSGTGGVGTYTLSGSPAIGVNTWYGVDALAANTLGAGYASPNLVQNSTLIQFASCTTAGSQLTSKWKMTTPVLARTLRVLKVQPYVAPAAQIATLTLNGTFTQYQRLVIKIIETTPGFQTLPTWIYETDLTTGTTGTHAGTDFNAKWGTGSTKPTSGASVMSTTTTDEWFHFSHSGGVITITAAAGAKGRTFRVAATSIPTPTAPTQNVTATYVYLCDGTNSTVIPTFGQGSADQIDNLIQEDNIRRGVSHYYPNQNANATEFGLPVPLDSTSTLIPANPFLVTLVGERTESSPIAGVGQTIGEPVYITIIASSALAESIRQQFPTV